MKTDDLIAGLAAHTQAVPSGAAWRRLALAVVLAVLTALLILKLGWGMRPDLHEAIRTGPFWMKALYTLTLSVAGLLLMERVGRPGARLGPGVPVLALAVLAITVLAVRELMLLPLAAWPSDWMGASSWHCPMRISILAAPAFGLALLTMRRMAPTRPKLAGAAAGLLAGGVGAAVYGLSCQETAAAFTAGWYTLGVALWAGVGALIGPKVLRW